MGFWTEYWRTRSFIKNNNRIKRTVTRTNTHNKGIQEYKTSEIEGFITENDINGNLVISGGSIHMRNRSIKEYCIYAYNNNIPVIIIHESNLELAREIYSLFSQVSNFTYIDSCSKNYNPFSGKNSDEAVQLIKDASFDCKEFTFNSDTFEYLTGISLLIHNITGEVPFDMFSSIPYDDIYTKINNRIASGMLSINDGNIISSRLLKGQQERYTINSYFNKLSFQGNGLFADISHRSNSVSLSTLIENKHISIIDIKSNVNTLLLNIVASELLQLNSANCKFIVVLSDVDIYSNSLLKKILLSNNTNWLLSTQDLFSSLRSDEAEFNLFSNMASKAFIMSHRNNQSATQWSNYLGEYDEAKISESTNPNYSNIIFIAQKPIQTLNVSNSKEKRVSASLISGMSDNEIFVKDNTTGTLYHAPLK